MKVEAVRPRGHKRVFASSIGYANCTELTQTFGFTRQVVQSAIRLGVFAYQMPFFFFFSPPPPFFFKLHLQGSKSALEFRSGS